MAIHPPHFSIHDATEFWYDAKGMALLFEVLLDPRLGLALADHKKFEGTNYNGFPFSFHHDHRDPHGVSLKGSTVGEYSTKVCVKNKVSVKNTELIIRLWCQIENNEQPPNSPYRDQPLLPVPKALALFLTEKQAEMYKEESFTQALILLQTYVTAKGIYECPLPT